jgi:elongation factor G
MGELHLDVLVRRLLTEFNVSARVGRPRVAYKETITQPAKAEGRFVRQSGGHGQYGHVEVDFEPGVAGSGFQFVDAIKGTSIPRNFIPAVQAGLREAMESGALAGYPVVDVKATLVDGSYHEVDSSELAFKIAASMALKDGMRKGKSIILEPIMRVEIVTPEEFLGDILSDLHSRRGQVESVETYTQMTTIHGSVPLAETFGYATSLRSKTQGRATHSMEFARYQQVPGELAAKIMKEAG